MMTEIEDRRNGVPLCKRNNLSAAYAEKDVIDGEHGTSMQLGQSCEGGLDFIVGAGAQQVNVAREFCCRTLQHFRLRLGFGCSRVSQHRDAADVGYQLRQN